MSRYEGDLRDLTDFTCICKPTLYTAPNLFYLLLLCPSPHTFVNDLNACITPFFCFFCLMKSRSLPDGPPMPLSQLNGFLWFLLFSLSVFSALSINLFFFCFLLFFRAAFLICGRPDSYKFQGWTSDQTDQMHVIWPASRQIKKSKQKIKNKHTGTNWPRKGTRSCGFLSKCISISLYQSTQSWSRLIYTLHQTKSH